jgi:hypothetical protein
VNTWRLLLLTRRQWRQVPLLLLLLPAVGAVWLLTSYEGVERVLVHLQRSNIRKICHTSD